MNPFGTKTQVALTAKKLPRGVTVFGSPDEYMDDIAEDNNMVWFLQQRGLSRIVRGEHRDPWTTESMRLRNLDMFTRPVLVCSIPRSRLRRE